MAETETPAAPLTCSADAHIWTVPAPLVPVPAVARPYPQQLCDCRRVKFRDAGEKAIVR